MEEGVNFILGERWSLLDLAEMNIIIPDGPWSLIPTDHCHCFLFSASPDLCQQHPIPSGLQEVIYIFSVHFGLWETD